MRSHPTKLLYAPAVVGVCWLGMQAVHELGHCLGAWVTGGRVESVVLHPLTISRTEVAPNPRPGIVVWMGPLVGILLPCAMWWVIPNSRQLLAGSAGVFAGFCLIANGLYLSLGSFQGIGDAGEMLQTGTPGPVLLVFGFVTVPWGLFLWHRLGSFPAWLSGPTGLGWRPVAAAWLTLGGLILFASMVSTDVIELRSLENRNVGKP